MSDEVLDSHFYAPVPIAQTVVSPFDYADLGPHLEDEARAAAARIKPHLRCQTEALFKAGDELLAIKPKLGHRQFGRWIQAEFAMCQRTAARYMAAARAFEGKFDIVSNLPPTTIYALSSRSVPASVRDAVIERLEAGEQLSHDTIQKMLPDAQKSRAAPKRSAAEEVRVSDEVLGNEAQEEPQRQVLPDEGQQHTSVTDEGALDPNPRPGTEEREAELARQRAALQNLAVLLAGRCSDDIPGLINLLNEAGISSLAEAVAKAPPLRSPEATSSYGPADAWRSYREGIAREKRQAAGAIGGQNQGNRAARPSDLNDAAKRSRAMFRPERP
jgi:hypothetical protein